MHDPLFPYYKPIRNKLRKLEPLSIVGLAIEKLHQVEVKGIDLMRFYQPWNLLLLIRWAFFESDKLAHRRRTATASDLRTLCNQIHELEGIGPLPNDYQHANLFLRSLAFQQFDHMEGPNGSAIARQFLIFASLDQGHDFRKAFHKRADLDIYTYLELSFAATTLLISRQPAPRTISTQHFDLIKSDYLPRTIERFLSSLAVSPAEAILLCQDDPTLPAQTIQDQRILPSPFLSTPILSQGNPSSYAIISPKLTLRCIESAVYRTLKSSGLPKFNQKIGKLFEAHVANCLRSAKIPFTTEKELNCTLGGEGKCVDFLIEEPGCHILVEAKAVEANAPSRNAKTAAYLLQKLKTSALKGIEQGMATKRRMSQLRSREIAPDTPETFLLIVTYEHLYIGSSYDMESLFGDAIERKLAQRYGPELPLKLEHVLFLDIEEFENLLSANQTGAIDSLAAALRFYVLENHSPQSRTLTFQQQLAKLAPTLPRLPLMENALRDLTSSILRRLPESQRRSAKARDFLK